jgi:excisionase family DNA binding protein
MWKPAELAALLRVDAKTVTRWVTTGRLPAVRTPGGHVRIPDSAVRGVLRGDHRPRERGAPPADTEEAL